ncbi:MAG: lytic transglycosylase domain-containing protein [Bacteroidales bacterium]
MNREKNAFSKARKGILWIGLPLLAAGAGLMVAKRSYSGEPEGEGRTDAPVYAVQGVDLPERVTFAGERMPLDLYDVREALDREMLSNVYFHSQTIRLMKLANRYFPVIEPILKKNLVPDDFKYLVLAESGLTQAVSPANAVGFWQLMKGTAQDYGLEVNAEVDERYHIAKSTEVACRYLIESYRTYGNWTMTAASYNAGRRGVERQAERQKKENYYDLLLVEETSRYLYRVVSFKLIFEDPEAYGFHVNRADLYPEIPVDKIRVDGAVADFADFAAEHGTNYKILKSLNPWLRDTKLTNTAGKSYEILVPKEGVRRADAWENQ